MLSPGPCYISAVHNTRQAGACAAQLVERLVDTGNTDIHIIGFSLGAQVPNYIARNLKSFRLPHITGLDPAMPLFVTSGLDDKLDPSDADFVDVIHTNALVQGKLERCGHADFYMNGGIYQPGCNGNMWMSKCLFKRKRNILTRIFMPFILQIPLRAAISVQRLIIWNPYARPKASGAGLAAVTLPSCWACVRPQIICWRQVTMFVRAHVGCSS